jgi:serine/threonine protein kinase
MLLPGTRVDAYEILGPISRGGMGEVYKARDTRVDWLVAVKVLPANTAGELDAQGRFERDVRALAALSHPRICSLFEFARHDGRALLVMEYLEGQSLAQRIGTGRIPLREALRIAIDVADALAAAHRAGLVHRDLKPSQCHADEVRREAAGLRAREERCAAICRRRPGEDHQPGRAVPGWRRDGHAPVHAAGTARGTHRRPLGFAP